MNDRVFMWPTLGVCGKRNRKGLHSKARAGPIKDFTGISDPYEPPQDTKIVINTSKLSPEKAAELILDYLRKEGYLTEG